MHIRRIAPLSRALSALASPIPAMPSRAPQARIFPSAWRNPPPPHSAPLYKTFTNPNSVYPARHQNLWSLSFKWGFYKVFVTLRGYLLWGLSIWCSVTLHVCLYMGLSMRSSFLSGSLFSIVPFTPACSFFAQLSMQREQPSIFT